MLLWVTVGHGIVWFICYSTQISDDAGRKGICYTDKQRKETRVREEEREGGGERERVVRHIHLLSVTSLAGHFPPTLGSISCTAEDRTQGTVFGINSHTTSVWRRECLLFCGGTSSHLDGLRLEMLFCLLVGDYREDARSSWCDGTAINS